MTLAEKLKNFEFSRKQIAAIVTILSAIPFFVTIGLPITIGTPTYDYYNEIEKLQPGSRIAMILQTGAVNYQAYKYGFRAVFYHLAMKHAQILVFPFEPDTPSLMLGFFSWIDLERNYGYVYGKDYVMAPYIAGREAALAALAENMRLFSTDAKGIPIAQLPMMNNFRTLRDMDLAICNYGYNDFAEEYVRQWPAKYGVRATTILRSFSDITQYYGKYIVGTIDGNRGAAEYEKLTGIGGLDIAVMDANSISLIFILAVTLFGMTQFYARRIAGKQKATI